MCFDKGFKQSLFHSVSVSLMSRCKVSCQNISTLASQDMGDTERGQWYTGSSLPASVSGHITSFLLFICMWDQPQFSALHNVTKDNTENSDTFCFINYSSSAVMIKLIILNQFLPLALSWSTTGHLLKTANNPAGNMLVPAKV